MVYIFINILTEFKLYEPKSTLLIFHCLTIIRWDHYAPFFSLNEDFTLTCMKLAKVTRYRNIMLGQPGNGGEGGGGKESKARGVGWVCVYQIPFNPRVGPHITYETLSSISEATMFYHSNPLVEVN